MKTYIFGINQQNELEDLANFKTTFFERYEEEEMPLLLALDSECGLSYPVGFNNSNSSLISGFTRTDRDNDATVVNKLRWTKFLNQKLIYAIENKDRIINLEQNEIEKFCVTDCKVPFSMNSTVQLFNDQGKVIMYHSLSDGPSSSTFLGRFCCSDKQLKSNVTESLKNEQNFYEDKIIAEVVHLPQSRIGNITTRPMLRNYEIPILTRANNDSNTIMLEDLMISIKNNRIVLRSKRLNTEIIPNLSTAHNYSLHKVPIYHFLCDLQYQDLKSSYSWNWGIFSGNEFLPRVMYKNVIISKASWGLEYDKIFGKKENSIGLLRTYLLNHNIPNNMTFFERDMELPVASDFDESLEVLLEVLKKEKNIRVFEDLFNKYDSIVRDEDNNKYNNEALIPWENTKANKFRISAFTKNITHSQKQRDFIPGSEWIYFKIYCGHSTADKLLQETLSPFLSDLIDQGRLKKWFFIRYEDPKFHIRLRLLKVNNEEKIENELSGILQDFVNQKMIWKVQKDTYKRELERYGETTIEIAESLFYHDSICVCKILEDIDCDNENRWKPAICGINYILDDFGFNSLQKKELMEQLAFSYLHQFKLDNPESRKILKEKYRENKIFIDEQFNSIFNYKNIFQERSDNTLQDIKQIKKLIDEKEMKGMVISFIHMFINRLFRSSPNIYEAILYEFLSKNYASSIARSKKMDVKIDCFE